MSSAIGQSSWAETSVPSPQGVQEEKTSMKADELVEILKGDGDAEGNNDMAQSGVISEEVCWSPLLTSSETAGDACLA